MVAPVSQRLKFVPSENATIAEPPAPFETKINVPAPEVDAEGAFATVNVGSFMSPINPAVEFTGPENVVLVMV